MEIGLVQHVIKHVDCLAILEARFLWGYLEVGFIKARPEMTEELRECQIEFSMAAPTCGVHDDRITRQGRPCVSSPEIPMQQARRAASHGLQQLLCTCENSGV